MRFDKGIAMKKGTVIAVATMMLVALATVALGASGGDGHHVDSGVLLKDFLWRCLSFGVTLGLLIYFVRKPIRQGLAGRRDGIEKALREAEAAKAEAEAKFAEYDRKLSKAAAEIEEIQVALRREGELERERTLASAREMTEKIKQEAEKSAANEVAKARTELRQEAARMAIAMAEGLLKKNFTSDDQKRLVSEYLQKVGELH
jgi:F-type H+-transporting ATPase subunit b